VNEALHLLHTHAGQPPLASIDGWELRQFHPHAEPRGTSHLQLWQPADRISIVTPSRLSAGRFEVRIAGELISAQAWPALERELARRHIRVPGRHTIRALERWFVLRSESKAARLLRTWWAGAEEYAR